MSFGSRVYSVSGRWKGFFINNVTETTEGRCRKPQNVSKIYPRFHSRLTKFKPFLFKNKKREFLEVNNFEKKIVLKNSKKSKSYDDISVYHESENLSQKGSSWNSPGRNQNNVWSNFTIFFSPSKLTFVQITRLSHFPLAENFVNSKILTNTKFFNRESKIKI